MDSMQRIKDFVNTLHDAKFFLESKIRQGELEENMPVVKNIVLAVEETYRDALEHGRFIDIDIVDLKLSAETLAAGNADDQDAIDFIRAIDNVVNNCTKLLSEKKGKNVNTRNNALDRDFYKLVAYVKETSLEELKDAMKKNLNTIKEQDVQIYTQMLYWYNTISLWGRLEPENGIFDLIDNRAGELKEHYMDLLWLYDRLGDYRSKRTFFGVMDNWLTFNSQNLSDIQDRTFKHYFDLDIINCDENEVFVDLGAYIGDTVIDYINSYNGYKKIYCYEIFPQTLQILKNNLKGLPFIDIRQKGASDKAGYMYVSDELLADGHKLVADGEIQVETVALDDDITEPITFIKMDIEGGEQDALFGCRRHIEKEHPKLAISIYHNNEDIWKCARIIDEMNPDYQFYFRYYGGNVVPVDFVLLAI